MGNLSLASPETKEHSRDAANRWLADQLKMSQDQPTRLGSVIDQLEKRKACAAAQGLQTQAFDAAVAMVRDMETDDIHPTIAQSFIEPMSQVWADRLSRTKPVPTDRTVGHWILPRQERSSQTGSHGTTPPYGRELPPGRTRKGKVDSASLFRVFRWIPWLISDPPEAAIGSCWTESAVRICADLGCRGNRSVLGIAEHRPGVLRSGGAGKPQLPNSASYLKHYLDLLRDDRRKIVKAASLAQKASDYILSGGVVPQAKKRRRASQAQSKRR